MKSNGNGEERQRRAAARRAKHERCRRFRRIRRLKREIALGLFETPARIAGTVSRLEVVLGMMPGQCRCTKDVPMMRDPGPTAGL